MFASRVSIEHTLSFEHITSRVYDMAGNKMSLKVNLS